MKLKSLQPKVRTVNLSTVRNVEAGTPRIRGRKRIVRNARLFRRKPLCVECEKLGEVRQVDHWDHIVPLWEGGADTEANLQGLCVDHHAEKTAAELLRRLGTGGGVEAKRVSAQTPHPPACAIFFPSDKKGVEP